MRYQPDAGLDAALVSQYHAVQTTLDAAFAAWLSARYAPLATQSLPEPHHLYHVLHYLAYRYLEQSQRVALLILDGLALADWTLIRAAWQARRPADFAGSLGTTQKEPQHWQSLGERYGLARNAVLYSHLRLTSASAPDLSSVHTRWACLVDTSLDEMLHGDALGSASLVTGLTGTVVSSLRYTPYGLPRGEAGRLPTAYRYTGQRDTGVGFYDYQARLYDPAVGRFVQADTIVPEPGDPQSLNRYMYVLGNPLKYIDPTGHDLMIVGGVGGDLVPC